MPHSFVPLEELLDSYFELPLDKLPPNIADRVTKDYNFTPWPALSPAQRRREAQRQDHLTDPDHKAQVTFDWENGIRSTELRTEMDDVRSKATPTMSEYDLQKRTLRELEAELRRVDGAKWAGHAAVEEAGAGHTVPTVRAGMPTTACDLAGDEGWKEQARTLARTIIKRQSELDCYPNQQHIADEIARDLRAQGVFGADGKPVSGGYIKRHALLGISSKQKKQLSTRRGQGK